MRDLPKERVARMFLGPIVQLVVGIFAEHQALCVSMSRSVDTDFLLLRKPGSLKVGRWLFILDSSSPVILKCVRSLDQRHQYHPETSWKCRIPAPSRPHESQALGVGPGNPYLTSPPEDSDVRFELRHIKF